MSMIIEILVGILLAMISFEDARLVLSKYKLAIGQRRLTTYRLKDSAYLQQPTYSIDEHLYDGPSYLHL